MVVVIFFVAFLCSLVTRAHLSLSPSPPSSSCSIVYILYSVRSRLFQSEFYYSIRSDFADIHGRTIRANGNCVRILKIAPMVNDLFGVWVDGETSDWNLW